MDLNKLSLNVNGSHYCCCWSCCCHIIFLVFLYVSYNKWQLTFFFLKTIVKGKEKKMKREKKKRRRRKKNYKKVKLKYITLHGSICQCLYKKYINKLVNFVSLLIINKQTIINIINLLHWLREGKGFSQQFFVVFSNILILIIG